MKELLPFVAQITMHLKQYQFIFQGEKVTAKKSFLEEQRVENQVLD